MSVPPVLLGFHPPRAAAIVRWRGFLALFRRELIGAWKFASVFLIGPLVSVGLYFLVFSLAAAGPERDAALAWLLPGLVFLTLTGRAFEMPCFNLIFEKLENGISVLLMAPIGILEILLAYLFTAIVVALASGLAVALGLSLLAAVPLPDPAVALLFAVLSAAMVGAFGLLVGLWAERFDAGSGATIFVLTPLTFISGVFAPVASLPDWLQGIVKLSPIYAALDGFRAGYGGGAEQPLWVSTLVVTATTALLVGACYVLMLRGYKLRA